MQIKTTVRYHLTSVRMVIFKKTTNNKCQQGWGEEGSTRTLLVGIQIEAVTMVNSMDIP